MLNRSLNIRRRPWFYPLLALGVALGLIFNAPAQAFSLRDLLINGIKSGIQIVQINSISDQQEMEIGKQTNDAMVQAGKFKILRDPALTNYVNQIGQRLIPYSDRPNLTYTFQVVDDKNINAFATMGGFVYVHSGLIAAADNEAQLASVIGHEMGHIGGKHSLQQAKQQALAQGVLGAAGLSQSTLVNIASQLVYTLPHSRKDEFDADTRGLRTLSNAGYAQPEMVTFMQKLLAFKSSTPSVLATHPATADRITQLNAQIKRNATKSTDGSDVKSYSQRVGKSYVAPPTVAPTVKPIVQPSPIPTPTPSPTVSPRPTSGDVIVPTN
jgi:beta-barrel assembly-enhancing protease